MDPAALGTALIGLEAIHRREAFETSEDRQLPRRAAPSNRRPSIRGAIAATLRSVADGIDVHPTERARSV
jgi:hypothetical protein